MSSVGSRIGPYTIERELGRGGMGVVYLAKDERLGRRVAIKTLPPEVAAASDRLARFEREARLLASLNHPNIATIYGVEEVEGARHLVLEYVEGEPLDLRLGRGALELGEALDACAQVAAGLEAAHEAGVIHRDLKPGNVIQSPGGQMKVLDFGLAKESSTGSSSGLGSDSTPTLTMHPGSPTMHGRVIGTAGYLSPEQARGRPVDRRTDIFSFGCVLFECLSGTRTFPGETPADTVAAVLDREPDWSRLPARTPTRVRELLRACLEKDPRRRLRDIGDARLELERAIERREWSSTASMAPGEIPALRARRGRAAARWAVLGLLLAGAAGAGWLIRSDPGSGSARRDTRPVKLLLDGEDVKPRILDTRGSLAISRDGRSVVFAGQTGEGMQALFVRSLEDASARPIDVPDVWMAADPAFSPDGSSIAYSIEQTLYLISAAGGLPTRLHAGSGLNKGACWTEAGIIRAPSPTSGLVLVDPTNGDSRELTRPDASKNEVSHRWPDALPDGRHVLMTVKKADILTFDDAEIALLDMKSGTWRTIISGGSYARFAPPGHIVYARRGTLLAVPFDTSTMSVTGPPTQVLTGVLTEPTSGAASFAVARDTGTLVYQSGGPNERLQDLVWFGFDGTLTPTGAPARLYDITSISPDGTRAASAVFGASDAIFVTDFERGTSARITFRGNSANPMWTPDGRQIVFGSDLDGAQATYIVRADGSGEPRRLFDGSVGTRATIGAMPDGLVYVYSLNGDIWLRRIPEEGTGEAEEARLLLGSQFSETAPSISPDGRWLAYGSDETGQPEVFVRPFPDGNGKWQISRGGGEGVFWSQDEPRLMYLRDMTFMEVEYSADSGFQAGAPIERASASGLFLPSVDGRLRRSLWVRPSPAPYKGDRVYVVLNWAETLQQRVPGK